MTSHNTSSFISTIIDKMHSIITNDHKSAAIASASLPKDPSCSTEIRPFLAFEGCIKRCENVGYVCVCATSKLTLSQSRKVLTLQAENFGGKLNRRRSLSHRGLTAMPVCVVVWYGSSGFLLLLSLGILRSIRLPVCMLSSIRVFKSYL